MFPCIEHRYVPLLGTSLFAPMTLVVGAGPRSYRKSCYIGTRKSKETVPERPRRESSTTALKAAAKIGGPSYPHKGKEAMGWGIEDKGQKGSDRGSGAHTHDQRQKSQKIAESCSVTSKQQFKVQIGWLSQLGFWVTLTIGPKFCITVRPSGHPFKHVFYIMKGLLVRQLER